MRVGFGACRFRGREIISEGEQQRWTCFALRYLALDTRLALDETATASADPELRLGTAGESARTRGRVGGGAHSTSWFRFRWMIMSCTESMVILRRLVSVALVKWP